MMRKKMVASALAVAVLSFAATAMAETGTGPVENRSTNTVFATSPQDTNSMPVFQADDEVSFIVTGVSEGDQITFITHKQGEEPSNTTVQYIDQYTASGSTQKINYIVRDIGDGIFLLKIKAGENELYQGYYKVGDVSAPTVLVGDVNNDSKVNSKDLTALARNIAKWIGYDDSNINKDAADTNGDGKVNSKDLTALARHIAKWIGYETLPVK